MSEHEAEQRLSRITTIWTLVYHAHGKNVEAVTSAQKRLVERYGGAIHRYLLGALKDQEAADELFQDFCVRFLRGAFRNADPDRGRFRDFLKTAVFHLIVDYQNARRKKAGVPLDDAPPLAAPSLSDEIDQQFVESWRAELLDRAWQALAQLESLGGQSHFTVLRFRADHPLLSSDELAQQIGARLGKKLTVDAVRQALHRAREKFSDLLLDEVQDSLACSDRARLEEELAEIGLLNYCQAALARR